MNKTIEERKACIGISPLGVYPYGWSNVGIICKINDNRQLYMSVKNIEGYSIYMTEVLGKGSYGSVYKGRQLSTQMQVAVKILSKQFIDRDDYLKAALRNEIDILKKLHSDNIVGFHDVIESNNNYYIIQELCDGDISGEIKPGKENSEAVAVDMLRQICNGFLALVREGIIHRDLKPANIMKKGSILKIGDFGFAKQSLNKSMMKTTVGTPLYMSLQILKAEEYTSKCDIWALGFIFYEILHGVTPWIAKSESQLVKNILNIPLKMKRNDLSEATINFLQRCLGLTQQDRISWDQIFVHPIFKGYFLEKANEYKQFQNKMKTIMGRLRFYISQKNLDMGKMLNSFGFNQDKEEINFQEFMGFFLKVHPELTKDEAQYVFKRTDNDGSGSISVDELQHLLAENGIKLQTQFDVIPKFEKQSDGKETFNKISAETSLKIKSCFQKLYKCIVKKNLSLWKVFISFDKKKGSLSFNDFSQIVKKLTGNSIVFDEDQIKNAFDLIDEDASGTIEFEELGRTSVGLR